MRAISHLAEASVGDGMDQYASIEQESQSVNRSHYRGSEWLAAKAFQRGGDEHE